MNLEKEYMKNDIKKIPALRCIVGSVAHGLATNKSDIDLRGVFITPTEELLRIGAHPDQTSWIENETVDNCEWEIGKFLLMATKCNPTVLEVFKAPWSADGWKNCATFQDGSSVGDEIKKLFPYVWNSQMVKDAFIGYSLNQRKKFFDNKDQRAPKYAAAYLRVLYNAYELLSTGDFSVSLIGSPVYDQVKKFKNGNYTAGEVIDACFYWETKVLEAYKKNPYKETEMDPINEFLLRVRKEFWNAN